MSVGHRCRRMRSSSKSGSDRKSGFSFARIPPHNHPCTFGSIAKKGIELCPTNGDATAVRQRHGATRCIHRCDQFALSRRAAGRRACADIAAGHRAPTSQDAVRCAPPLRYR
jgi:hypothetical protein